MIEPEGFRMLEAVDLGSATAQLEHEPALVLLDLRLGDGSGVDLLSEIQRRCPDSETIMMTGYATVDSAVSCMRAGAFDYLEKPFSDQHRVVQTLRRALERRALRVRNRELEGELDRRTAFEGIVIESPPMRRVARMILDLAPNESNVLIEAESGTGKELIARAIHKTSVRRDGPFVPVDCGALPEGIVEAELFGHVAGAFTGATRSAPGLFRRATGGTLFLDEIGELPAPIQAKLLRAIQEREVRPLGAVDTETADVRIVAATNRDLETEVRENRFRADLFYRLRVVSIRLPPLRERREEIPVLALHFL
jgi:DNA-binding NtrC family response regulator